MTRFFRCACLLALLVAAPLMAMGAERRGPFNEPPQSVRSRDFDQQHIRLELDFDFQRRRVDGRAVITLAPLVPLDEIRLDAADMQIDRVMLRDGPGRNDPRELQFATQGDELTVVLDRRYEPAATLTLAIDYRLIEPQRGIHFVIPDGSDPRERTMAWTHSEPIAARYWFPSFDSPNDRITSEVLATVPEDFVVVSNGKLKSKEKASDGRRTWHFVQEKSHVTYLVSVVAGRFEALSQEWEDVPVVSYVPKGRLNEARRSFDKTPEMIGFFSEQTGYRYPWPGYTQICVDRYVAGGMEHTTATTLTSDTLHDARAHLDHQSDGLVSHELAHQWYGDLITCKDFGELWLNESFATYFATLWIEHDRGADEGLWRRYGEAESYFAEDKDRYRRPIVTYGYEHPRDMFDRHSYPKGARVLHMLRFVLGEERFWRAIRHYTREHAFGTVETADLRIAIEESTGQGLNWFFREWLEHGGHPEYEVSYRWDEAEKMLRVEVKQTQEVDELTPLFRMPVEIELVLPDETLIRRVEVSKREETFHFGLPERPRWVCFDPRDWVLKKLVTHKSKQEWVAQLAEDENVICRVRAVHALAELAKDGDAEAALGRAAREDPFWAVRGEAAEALSKFRGDEVRATLLRLARDDPKSDVRRAAVESLGRFPEKETPKALREVIRKDRSYETVAAALRSLVKVDKDGCRNDLTAALKRPSRHEVIRKAAAEGLAASGDAKVVERLLAILRGDEPIGRRAAVLGAAAKLAEGRTEVTDAIAPYLDDPRHWVRRAAVEALGATGDAAAVDLLLKRRDIETSRRTQRMIDKAVEKLRERNVPVQEIRKQLDELKQENRRLRERVERLEGQERG